jgi:hypothetical protein
MVCVLYWRLHGGLRYFLFVLVCFSILSGVCLYSLLAQLLAVSEFAIVGQSILYRFIVTLSVVGQILSVDLVTVSVGQDTDYCLLRFAFFRARTSYNCL